MAYRSGLVAAVAGLLGTLCMLWTCYCFETAVAGLPPGFPRSFPYPDKYLLALHDYYDRQYPSPPGTIKIHGEIDRVRTTLKWVLGGCLTMFAIGAFPVVRERHRARSKKGPYFPISGEPDR